MRYFFIVLTLLTSVSFTQAQSTEDSVKAVINNLFTAMKNADPVLLKSCFADSAVMQTVTRNKEGKVVVRNDVVEGFANFIAKEKAGAADERISFDVIRIDGLLASVWTPYNFYYNGTFSHCGVNSFQLVRFNGIWKIQYLIDTRRKTGCTP